MLDKKSYFIHNNKDQFEYLKKILPYFLFCIIIFILYSYSINYSFLNGWDDQGYVTNNTHIKFSLNNLIYWLKNVLPVGGYTPLVMYSFMLDFYIGGYNPEVYHIQNIVWHIFAVSILFNTFKLFKINTFVAFLLCLLFAIHPQRVESVVWISQRKDVMCAAFYFLTINLYVRNSNLKSKYLSLMTFFAFICALLSKPMAVSLPFILMFYDIYKCKNYNIIKHLKNIWFYFLIIISVSCFTAINFPRAIHRLTVMQDVYVGMYNFYWYIVTFFWPKNLNPFYARVSYDNTYYVLIYFYTLFILLYILLYFNSKKIFLYRILPILLSYFFAFLPICGLFRPAVKDYSDRFSYIPSIFITFGIGLLATKLLAMCKEKNIKIFNFRYLRIYIDKIFLLLFTLVCLFYGIIFFDYNLKIQKYWSSLYSLYKSSILLTTPNLIVLSRLGDMEREGKNYQALLNIGNILNDQFKTDRITEQEKLNIFF
ncbi:MAG: hypothetical protein GY756_21640, partial [bacterium]|nr:hypothetical protein [bacterium]